MITKRIEVGHSMYLFTDDITPGDVLLISAHGGYMNRPDFGKQTGLARHIPGLGGWIEVPSWTSLVFFGPHTSSVDDSLGINNAVLDDFLPYEILGKGAKVRNYSLGKYQGAKHNNVGEDYSVIEGEIQMNRMVYNSRISQANTNPNGVPVQLIPAMDILTIRNRGLNLTSDVPLLEVFKQLEKKGLKYKTIHCYFCRSPMLFGEGPCATPVIR